MRAAAFRGMGRNRVSFRVLPDQTCHEAWLVPFLTSAMKGRAAEICCDRRRGVPAYGVAWTRLWFCMGISLWLRSNPPEEAGKSAQNRPLAEMHFSA
jgi:hypothetical protein